MESIEINSLRIEVKRSPRRKTLELDVGRDGQIILYAPEGVAEAKLESLVKQKLVWIYQKLSRKEEELHRFPQKEFVSGEGFYCLGRKYRLKLLDDGYIPRKKVGLELKNGQFLMPRQLATKGRNIFINWYTKRATEWISRRVRMLQPRVAAELKSFGIRDLGFRWGSCTRKGKMLFHWRIILLPPERIDYLILHELVHIHEHNHSPAFYERLRRASPNFELHEEWLRRHGDQYSL
jgi:predicted metal-dependent hydrolase